VGRELAHPSIAPVRGECKGCSPVYLNPGKRTMTPQTQKPGWKDKFYRGEWVHSSEFPVTRKRRKHSCSSQRTLRSVREGGQLMGETGATLGRGVLGLK